LCSAVSATAFYRAKAAAVRTAALFCLYAIGAQ
jgi:hypothetical protein